MVSLGNGAFLTITTPDVAASGRFFARLGYRPVTFLPETLFGPCWSDGQLLIALQAGAASHTTLTYVSTDLSDQVFWLTSIGIAPVSQGRFDLAFVTPGGLSIKIVQLELRWKHYPEPAGWSRCGNFAGLGLRTPMPATSKAFWQELGFVADGENRLADKHQRVQLYTPDLFPRRLRSPVITYREPDLTALTTALKANGPVKLRELKSESGELLGALLAEPGGQQLWLQSNERVLSEPRNAVRFRD